ncbi:hypothetical protein [Shimazuella kribbensis]|uniref:hypothetical protein n=1 Tax=Shimazuella kribbensis TaxID=139808 RepID=UPI0003F9933A|nr:hypothetical protein [Shimazuella kribbensis]
MKKLAILASSLVLLILLATGCMKPETQKNPGPKPDPKPVVEEQKTPLEVLKETQKKIATIQGYKFTRMSMEKGYTDSYNNTESGVEQLNPQVAHFTNSKNNEYYYDKQNVYMKKDGQWFKKANADGKVLVSVLFTNNVEFLLQNLGTKDEVPGITVTKKADEYIVTVDYLVFKDPEMSDADFTKSKTESKIRKTELVIDANSFEPKKYMFNYESMDGKKLRSVDMDLASYITPVVIPADVMQNAQPAPTTPTTPNSTT